MLLWDWAGLGPSLDPWVRSLMWITVFMLPVPVWLKSQMSWTLLPESEIILKSTCPAYIGADLGLSIIGSFLLFLLSTGGCGPPDCPAGWPVWPPSRAMMMSTSPWQVRSISLASSMLTPLRLPPFTLTSSSPWRNLPSLQISAVTAGYWLSPYWDWQMKNWSLYNLCKDKT